MRYALLIAILLTPCGASAAQQLRVAVVQTVIEDTLPKNQAKLLRFVRDAAAAECQLVIFPENALYWPEVSVHEPATAELDQAIASIGRAAREHNLFVIFGTAYRRNDKGRYRNRGVVFDASGSRLVFYEKDRETPQRFDVFGVPCNLAVCSDRGYLEHSDLPCLVQGTEVIIDTSGGHGGDDGGDELPLIRYRPWAQRNDAFVIVSNPVHDDTDFMGRSPWGGGSAIIRPDGSVQSGRKYEKDVMIVEELDTTLATRTEAERRADHPAFRDFWAMGKRLLEGASLAELPNLVPYVSDEREICIAAAQISCSSSLTANTKKINRFIRQAAAQAADVVVFPELAVTGARDIDVLAATKPQLEAAVQEIQQAARNSSIYVIVGLPYFVGDVRKNGAVVIDDSGVILTRYAQLVTDRSNVFEQGTATQPMWFSLKGVKSVVTIGSDARWVEIGDLAANRGMSLHFHLSYEADTSNDDATLRKQRNLLALMYAQLGAVVNAANPAEQRKASSAASGGSLIVSREGGHNQPSPSGLEYYLPYQTSIVKSAGETEMLLVATRRAVARNKADIDLNWRNRSRRSRPQRGWHDWIKQGATKLDDAAAQRE